MIISCFSCASFPKNIENPHFLHRDNINSLNGKYDVIGFHPDSITDRAILNHLGFSYYPTFYDEIDNNWLSKSIKINTSKSYSFILKILNFKKLKIYYIENDVVISEKEIKYKLKKDGYLYLKNKNLRFLGIPYLFGEIDLKRIRLTLNKEHNLLFELSEFESGGLFLLMVYPVGKTKYKKIFSRMDN